MIKKIKFIDLGLPSGNLWGDRNLFESKSNPTGRYYHLGKDRVYNGFSETLLKTNTIQCSYKVLKSDLSKSTLNHDIVTQILGVNYRIPRKEDFYELLKYTEIDWNGIFQESFVLFLR